MYVAYSFDCSYIIIYYEKVNKKITNTLPVDLSFSALGLITRFLIFSTSVASKSKMHTVGSIFPAAFAVSN